jgi:hypothetical protein
MNYPSLRIEGAILSPDILDRLEELPGQKPQDFGLDSSAKVKDEIARAWADAQDYWRIFQRKLEAVKGESPATTETRQLWVGPLLGLLGYQLEYQARGTELHGKLYSISHRAANRANAPVQIVGYREPSGLDRKPERANVRMSAHAVVQEFINLNDQLYGIVTNGRLLRLLRDSSRLIRLSYVEFDLDRMFGEALYADFAVMYRLLHASRLPPSHEAAAESWIERYHQDSLDSGARIREGLSRAVEQAIRNFGNGFLAHEANVELRAAVASGSITPANYYQHLLRLIYRLLFLMVIEERDLVFPMGVSAKWREVYRHYYSLQRLRGMSERRYLADHRRHDLWLGLLSTFRLFEADGPGPKLGLAPLAGDLFATDAIGPLRMCRLGNDVLLSCIRSLGLYTHPESGQLIRVNYGALNVEEFGSVYEGLLEYEPVFFSTEVRPEFGFKAGDERSRTGSHYTPDDLVQPLIKHSLDHLIADRLQSANPEAALLNLRVADISCGSGHILLAAARRIATELAVVRTGEEQPSPSAYRNALRDVIRSCIYGVDLNPAAVELCKVALWLEAHSPGEPLNFLDHHIKCGNSIIGFVRREELEKGVPDEAFATLPGDDGEFASALRKRNKAERAGQEKLRFNPEVERQIDEVLKGWRDLDALPEHTPEQVEAKRQRFETLSKSLEAQLMEQLASIPIAQFYIPKVRGSSELHITDDEFRRLWDGERTPESRAAAEAWEVAVSKRFFHWFLGFPDVIARGGFDCLLGNPPYLGGQSLSSTFGHPFCKYVKWEYAPTGLSDLVVFFVRRMYALLAPHGSCAFITTNSIKDGDIRKDGLERVLAAGGQIVMAVRGVRWPGKANLTVSLIAIHKDQFTGHRWLDGREVDEISAFLEDERTADPPVPLDESRNKNFVGTHYLGDGFVFTRQEAERLISENVGYSEVLFPLFNCQDLNSSPDLRTDRYIAHFFDWAEDRARLYPAVFERVHATVRLERATQTDRRLRENWWLFKRPYLEIAERAKGLKRFFACGITTKYLSYSALTIDHIVSHAVCVFVTDRWDLFGVVQSSIHEVWARKLSGEHEVRLRYSPSESFETFPFPAGIWQAANPVLMQIAEQYHEHRRRLMLELWLGLTDIYNLFHTRDLTPMYVAKVSKKPMDVSEKGYLGIVELRQMHRELDCAVRDAYGWPELELAHEFHEIETLPENDRVRYTISPAARKAVLKRMLDLNHARAADEKAAGVGKAKGTRRRKGGKGTEELFG